MFNELREKAIKDYNLSEDYSVVLASKVLSEFSEFDKNSIVEMVRDKEENGSFLDDAISETIDELLIYHNAPEGYLFVKLEGSNLTSITVLVKS